MLAGTYKSVSLICTASSTAISAIVVRFQVEVKPKQMDASCAYDGNF